MGVRPWRRKVGRRSQGVSVAGPISAPIIAGLFAAGFLAGSIPFGFFIGKAKGIDIRKLGSGNIGATNLGRLLGRRYFFLCFTLDVLKGLLPTLLAGYLLRFGAEGVWFWLLCAVAPVLGHVFCPWLGFKGGKGVATGLGAVVAVYPVLTFAAAGAFVIWAITAGASRYISLASIVAAASLPLWCAGFLYLGEPSPRTGERLATGWPYLVTCAALAILVVWTHRQNIRRLRSGTERRIGQRVETT